MLHINAGLALDREHNWNRTVGGILEGPHDWTVRPALELVAERNSSGSRTNSALAGVIWRAHEDLSFDFGVRAGRTDEQDVLRGQGRIDVGFFRGEK